MTWRTLTKDETAQPGDLALHAHKDLDPRRVVVADSVNGIVFLDIGGQTFGPYPYENYKYERWEG